MTDRFDWSLQSIADHLDGTLIGEGSIRVTSVSTDSRSVGAGVLFVAIEGERLDGNRFAAQAVEDGAAAAIVHHGKSDAVPRIEVEDTGAALLRLAARRRDELTMPVVAITGSTGKTTTKDLVASAIPGSAASRRSYNNEIGVPLTVLDTPSDASVLVLEVGSRGPGHIRWLEDAIRPDVAVITNLGVVHMETFGSPQGLADAKYELVELLGPDGVAVLPTAHLDLHRHPKERTVTFGEEEDADIIVGRPRLDDAGRPSFEVTVADWNRDLHLAVAGLHQSLNAGAAIGVAVALEQDLDGFAIGLEGAIGSDWRMDIRSGDVTIVNDAYNANPQSVEAALRTLAQMDGRHIAVLGPMAELGPLCELEHRRIGALAADLDYEEVIVVGVDHGYALGAPELVRKVPGIASAADSLARIVRPGDIVLVKASRSAGLETLALDLIREHAK